MSSSAAPGSHALTDTWSCRDGDWRIDERRYENDLTQMIPVNDPFGL